MHIYYTRYILLLNLNPCPKEKKIKDSAIVWLIQLSKSILIFVFSVNKMTMCLADSKLLKFARY